MYKRNSSKWSKLIEKLLINEIMDRVNAFIVICCKSNPLISTIKKKVSVHFNK